MILRRAKSHSTPLLLRHLSAAAPPQLSTDSDEAAAVLRIISSSSTIEAMSAALRTSKIFLSTDLIDSVLKLSRFVHSNPLRVLEFFNLAAARRGFFHSPFSCDTMLYILGRSRHFDLAFKLLDDMRRKDPSCISTRTLMVLLGRVAKVCSVRQTVKTFRRFRRFVSSDSPSATFNALLRTLCQEKSMSDARNVYHSLKHEYRPDLQTFNILLSGWKSSEDAEAFLAEMLEFDVKPDIVTYNCLIDA